MYSARDSGVCLASGRSVGTGAAAVLLACTAAGAAQQVVNSNVSFTTQSQSIWSSGDAFTFDYSQFFGIDVNPSPVTINPGPVSGTGYHVDPYFLFDTDFRTGMQVGAHVNGGSIDANLDYGITLSAPDAIVQGQAITLTGAATKLGSSGFQSSPANAEAYLDGILDVYFGGYARFVTSGFALGSHDYRMGNRGFTDGATNNNPYRTLVNVNYSPEIFSINRDASGQLKVLGTNQGGTGSDYVLGSTTITAGNWNVAATGALVGGQLAGSDEKTLVTATIDIDQMATSGVPVLGTGFAHDWGVIEMDMSYEVVDVTASMAMGLRQAFEIGSSVMARLKFDQNVMVEGVGETDTLIAPLDALPAITLMSESVTVTPEFIVNATLSNDTDLTFSGGMGFIFIAGRIFAAYDAGLFGSGTAANASLGPIYESHPTIDLFDIGVFSDTMDLGGFDTIMGESFVLTAAAALLGDMNVDGVVDAVDVAPFVLALTDPGQYAAQYGLDPLTVGDINGDGVVDAVDVAPFVQLLVGGGGGATVPEPGSAAVLVMLGIAGVMRRGRQGRR